MPDQDVPTVDATRLQVVVTDSQTVDPFAGVTVTDPSPDASDMVTITLSSGDANGTLSGAGLSETAPGVYLLTAGNPTAADLRPI